jgi:hypothetical protein
MNIGNFIFDGENKRLRNVTKLYCQCQISHKRRKNKCLSKFKFSLNRLNKLILMKPQKCNIYNDYYYHYSYLDHKSRK